MTIWRLAWRETIMTEYTMQLRDYTQDFDTAEEAEEHADRVRLKKGIVVIEPYYINLESA